MGKWVQIEKQEIPYKHQKKTCQKALNLELGGLFFFIPLSNTFSHSVGLEETYGLIQAKGKKAQLFTLLV